MSAIGWRCSDIHTVCRKASAYHAISLSNETVEGDSVRKNLEKDENVNVFTSVGKSGVALASRARLGVKLGKARSIGVKPGCDAAIAVEFDVCDDEERVMIVGGDGEETKRGRGIVASL